MFEVCLTSLVVLVGQFVYKAYTGSSTGISDVMAWIPMLS